MLDTHLVDAFSYISDNESKERIIVIEDIDTLFDERKKGDKENGITLQGFLNCLDGFTCVEGTMLFVTANKPEVLDYAMVRSCRIDHKLKLDYADRYQTEKMFHTFLPEQSDKFNEFYNDIRHREFTTAMLQEFLFYNRDCENIMEIIDKLEGYSRGIYTGGLGYITAQGDMDFNIGIRTMTVKGSAGVYPVGGGIVWDSEPLEEWLEAQQKGKILSPLQIETSGITPQLATIETN